MAATRRQMAPLMPILLLLVANGASVCTATLLGNRNLSSGVTTAVRSAIRHVMEVHQQRPQASWSGRPHAAFVVRDANTMAVNPPKMTLDATAPHRAASCAGFGCRVLGVGAAVPTTRINNDELSQVVDTNDEWIRTRTGISARRVLLQGESLRDLALRAARDAVASAGAKASDIDILLHSSSSPDDLFGDGPALSAQLQNPGEQGPPAFDITAACSGFVVGLVTAHMFLTSPGSPYRRALLVGADALSRWVDWGDRNTCILFGDAAGAAFLAAPTADSAAHPSDNWDGGPLGLLSYIIHSDGTEQRQIRLAYEGSENPLPYTSTQGRRVTLSRGCFSPMYMNGREVFKFVSRKVPGSLESVLAAANLKPQDVDWLLMHQANKRIIDAVAERLKIPKEKVLCNLEEYGNTSAASIPLCFTEAVAAGKVKRGQIIAMAGFGAGLTWAAAILRYG